MWCPGQIARRGFTLTELLVVISVIALLAALLLPALSRAKIKAIETQCRNNQHQLAIAFAAYAVDHRDAIVPYPTYGRYGPFDQHSSLGGFVPLPSVPVAGPLYVDDIAFVQFIAQHTAEVDLAVTRDMLRTNNPLFAYAPNVEVYHCPGDKRFQRNPLRGSGWGYLSYAKTDNMAGDPWIVYHGLIEPYRKFASIRNPASTLAMADSTDDSSYDAGPWYVTWLNVYNSPEQTFNWGWHAPALFHETLTTFAYADGHVATHKWTEPALVVRGLALGAGNGFSGTAPYPPNSGSDYYFVGQNYQFPMWKLPMSADSVGHPAP